LNLQLILKKLEKQLWSTEFYLAFFDKLKYHFQA
jgi:hypothetical protein